MAKALVAQLKSPFEPKTCKDEHRERVLEMLRQKAKGMAPELSPTRAAASPRCWSGA